MLVIGYFIAKLVGKLVHRVAQKAGLDRTLHSGPGGPRYAVTDTPAADIER